MSNKTLLLADPIHINEKNFKSFLAFFRSRQVTIVSKERTELPIDAFGNYDDHREILTPWRAPLASMSVTQLGLATSHGVNLFSVSCAETISLAITQNIGLITEPSHPSESRMFDELSRYSYEILLDNMAAAAWWLDHWVTTLKATPRLAYVAVFSGSLTYARVLLELMKLHPARCFVLESFFTGLHYYCEERYSPIANSSDIRLGTIRKALGSPADVTTYEVKRNAVRKVVEQTKNKNVTQPEAQGKLIFRNGHPTLLILGQVMNDFSLLDSSAGRMNSVWAYRELIETVLDKTEWNVLFKAHPWERKKSNLKRPITKETIEATFGENPRVICVEDYALADAFRECHAVACLNSQSGIEAAIAGFKPVQFGGAFWGRNGFSHDLALDEIGTIPQLLQHQDCLGLSLAEFDQLEKWLVTCLDGWLIEEAVGRASEARLKQIFHEISAVPAVAPAAKASTGLPQAKKSTPATGPAKEPHAAASNTSNAGVGLFRRRINKLVRRPDQFFLDSRIRLFQWVGLAFASRGSR